MINRQRVYNAAYTHTYDLIKDEVPEVILAVIVQYEMQKTVAKAENPDKVRIFRWAFGEEVFTGRGQEGLDIAIIGFNAGIAACKYRLLELEQESA